MTNEEHWTKNDVEVDYSRDSAAPRLRFLFFHLLLLYFSQNLSMLNVGTLCLASLTPILICFNIYKIHIILIYIFISSLLFHFSYKMSRENKIIPFNKDLLYEGEPCCSGKVVPWWLVGHGFESENSLFAYARVRLRTISLPHTFA